MVKDGRFGAYVTDGETNRTLPRDVTPESITPEQAVELLAEKRASGPAKKKAPARRAPAKPRPPRRSSQPPNSRSAVSPGSWRPSSAATIARSSQRKCDSRIAASPSISLRACCRSSLLVSTASMLCRMPATT